MIPKTLDDVFELAIAEEERAAQVYRTLAASAGTEDVRNLFSRFALEEQGHRDSLMRVRMGDLEIFAKPWPKKTELVFHPRQGDLSADVAPQALILAAMDDERRAMVLYTELANTTDDPGVKTLLDAIAREEAHHWSALEKIYDSMCELPGENTPES